MTTRRDILRCFAASTIALVSSSKAAPVDSAVGGRHVLTSISADNDDAYWREVYEMILQNTLPVDSKLELHLTSLKDFAFACLRNLKELTITGLTSMTAGYILQNSQVEYISLPDMTECHMFFAYGAKSLKTIHCPKLSSNMLYLTYVGSSSSLQDIFINNMQCKDILAIPNFPGSVPAQNSNYKNMVFHGADGTIEYNETSGAWEIV